MTNHQFRHLTFGFGWKLDICNLDLLYIVLDKLEHSS